MSFQRTTAFDFSELLDSWPSPLVAREKVAEFSGGLLHPATLANHDSRGDGPRGRVRVGRKIAYPAKGLVEWMQGRAESLS